MEGVARVLQCLGAADVDVGGSRGQEREQLGQQVGHALIGACRPRRTAGRRSRRRRDPSRRNSGHMAVPTAQPRRQPAGEVARTRSSPVPGGTVLRTTTAWKPDAGGVATAIASRMSSSARRGRSGRCRRWAPTACRRRAATRRPRRSQLRDRWSRGASPPTAAAMSSSIPGSTTGLSPALMGSTFMGSTSTPTLRGPARQGPPRSRCRRTRVRRQRPSLPPRRIGTFPGQDRNSQGMS